LSLREHLSRGSKLCFRARFGYGGERLTPRLPCETITDPFAIPVRENRLMPIAVTCPACQKSFRVNAAHAGKKGRCPGCQNLLDIPAAPARPAAESRPAVSPREVLMREILDAFEGNIPRVRVGWTYRVGVLLVTVAMLLLPVCYLAFIGAV